LDNKGFWEIATTINHDSPIEVFPEKLPLLSLSLWEHSYFLDHYNSIDNYVNAWWQVINWDYVYRNLKRAARIEHGSDLSEQELEKLVGYLVK